MAGCSISSNSFLPEVMAGYHAGMEVVALTFVSTMSAGIGPPIDLGPVLELTRKAHADYRTILRAADPGPGLTAATGPFSSIGSEGAFSLRASSTKGSASALTAPDTRYEAA